MIKPYLQLIRAPNGLTAISNIIAASVIVSSAQLSFEILYLVLASMCFYYGGMVLNDCFDYQEDLTERPNRPLPSKQISLKNAWLQGYSLLLAGLVLTCVYSTHIVTLGVSLALCTVILLYNGYIKEGLPGSIMMGLCRYFNWCLGLVAVSLSLNGLPSNVFMIALPIFFYICGLTFISKQETHAKNKRALWVLTALLAITVLSLIGLIVCFTDTFKGSLAISIGLVILWLGWLLSRLIPVWRNFNPSSIQQLVMWMVIGVIPFDALLVAFSGQYLWAVAILMLLPPCRWMSHKLYMT